MRCISLLTCGVWPLWEAVGPRLREARANNEARRPSAAEGSVEVVSVRFTAPSPQTTAPRPKEPMGRA